MLHRQRLLANRTLPGEALELNRVPQYRQELRKLLAFLVVTEYVLLGELVREFRVFDWLYSGTSRKFGGGGTSLRS